MSQDDEIVASIKFQADNKGVNVAITDVKKDLAEVLPAAEKAEGGLKKFFEAQKQLTGRRSGIGETLEVLKGAGAAFAVAEVGNILKEVTAKAGELRQQFREGKTDAEGVALGIGESIPILGGFVTAAANVNEFFSGQKAIHEANNEAMKAGNEILEERQKQLAENAKEIQEIADAQVEANARLREAQAGTPKERIEARAQSAKEQNQQRYQDKKDVYDEKQDADAKHQVELAAKKRDADLAEVRSHGGNTSHVQNNINAEYADEETRINVQAENKKADHEKELKKNQATADAAVDAEVARAKDTAAEVLASKQAARMAEARTVEERDAARLQALIENGKTPQAAGFAVAAEKDKDIAEEAARQRQSVRETNDRTEDQNDVSPEEKVDRLWHRLKDRQGETGITDDQIDAQVDATRKALTVTPDRSIKENAEQETHFGANDRDKLHNSDEYRNASDEQKGQLDAHQESLEDQALATKGATNAKQLEIDSAEAGKTAFEKLVDERNREIEAAARLSGASAEATDALKAQTQQQLAHNSALDELAEQGKKHRQAGMTDLERYQDEQKASGHSGGDLADLTEGKAKELGDSLHDSLMTPYEQFAKKQKELSQIEAEGGFQGHEQDYRRAQQKNAQGLMSDVKENSIEGAFMDNLKARFVGPQIDPAMAENNKALEANTKAMEENTKAHQNQQPQGFAA